MTAFLHPSDIHDIFFGQNLWGGQLNQSLQGETK